MFVNVIFKIIFSFAKKKLNSSEWDTNLIIGKRSVKHKDFEINKIQKMVTNVGMFVDSYAHNKVACIEQYAHKFH